jgi:hypothetical protein
MRVGEKDEVNPRHFVKLERRRGQSLRTNGKFWQSDPDARKEHWVGKNFDAEEINEHRSMPDPG